MAMFMRLLRDAAQKHGLCILVSIPSIVSSLAPHPYHFGARTRPSPMLMRAHHALTGVERRNGGESPGARPILHVHD